MLDRCDLFALAGANEPAVFRLIFNFFEADVQFCQSIGSFRDSAFEISKVSEEIVDEMEN